MSKEESDKDKKNLLIANEDPEILKKYDKVLEELNGKLKKIEPIRELYAKTTKEPEPNNPRLTKKELLELAQKALDSGKKEDFTDLENKMGDDKTLNAEVILEVTKGLNASDETYKKFSDVYDKKVRSPNPIELKEFDKIFQELPPKDLGKFLFREDYKNKPLQNFIKEEHHNKLEQATTLLQANIQKTLPLLTEEQRSDAKSNLLDNLRLDQMSKIIETVEGHQDYSKKNWLSKALSAFVDAVRGKFSGLKPTIAKGITELMEKGAGVSFQPETKIVSVTKSPGKSR